MNITDADREAAWTEWEHLRMHTFSTPMAVEHLAQWGEAHRLRGYNAGLEAAAAIVGSGMFNSHGRAQPALAAKLRALAGETE